MQGQLKCAICEQEYTQNKIPRLLPKCGHSYCQLCAKELFNIVGQNIMIICPQDEIEMVVPSQNIQYLPKNLALIDLFRVRKQNRQNKYVIRYSSNQENKQFEQSYNRIQKLNNSSKMSKQPSKKQEYYNYPQKRYSQNRNEQIEICQLHSKQLQIICLTQMVQICTMCAIFGQHKGHQVKSVKQVQQIIKNQYNQLQGIYKKSKNLNAEIWSDNNLKEFLKQLNEKKYQLIEVANNRFAHLMELLQIQKKKLQQKINMQFKRLQQKYIEQTKIMKSKQQSYSTWKTDTLKSLQNLNKKIENQSYFHCLKTQKNHLLLISQGQLIINDMQKLNQQFLNQKKKLKNSINLKINKQFQHLLKQFITLNINQTNQIKQRNTYTSGTNSKFHQLYDKLVKQPAANSTSQNITNQQFLLLDQNKNFNDYLEISSIKSNKSSNNISQNASYQQLPYSRMKESQFSEGGGYVIPVYSPVPKKVKNNLKTEPRQSINSNSSFILEKSCLLKKKSLKIKVPEKYEKIVQGITLDQLDSIDLTNAQLGDQIVIQILSLVSDKIKTLKLIRNRLTDEGLIKILPFLKHISTLNLAQNSLTDKSIEVLKQNLNRLPNLKNLVLSQNKINHRNVKNRLQDIKKYNNIVISL